MMRLCVFISGNGSNLQALIDAIEAKRLNAKIVLVVSNRPMAFGLQRAQKAGLPTLVFPFKTFKDAGRSRLEYDQALAEKVKDIQCDLIVLAGWHHVLSPAFLDVCPSVINLHPALPGQFDGLNAVDRAFHAYKAGAITETGVIVHWVVSETSGEVILCEKVPIFPTDTLDILEDRIHQVEHRMIVQAIQELYVNKVAR